MKILEKCVKIVPKIRIFKQGRKSNENFCLNGMGVKVVTIHVSKIRGKIIKIQAVKECA